MRQLRIFGRFSRSHPPDWLLLIALIAGLYLWQRTVFPPWMIDVFPNQFAAHQYSIADTRLIYTDLEGLKQWQHEADSSARRLGLDCDLAPYMYAPFVAATLSPVSGAPAIWWRDVLLTINTLLLFVMAWQILIECESNRSWRSALWALALVLVSYPMARATKLGQLVPLLAVLFWAGAMLVNRQREIFGGILLGIVGAIKLFPLAIIPVLFLHRKYRAAVSAVVSVVAAYGLSLAVIGFDLHRKWWAMMSDFGNVVIPFFGNQSLPAWIARFGFGQLMDDVKPVHNTLFDGIRILVLIVVASVTIYALWKSRGTGSARMLGLSLSLTISGVLLATSTAWEHYWLFVLPTLGYAVYDVWTHGDSPIWEWALAAGVFFFTMKLTRFYFDTPVGQIMSGSQTVGMLIFWIWLMRRTMQAVTPVPSRT